MSSAINPLGSSSQTLAAGNQVSKTMHSQAATTYGEPSIIPQGGLGIVHTNTNVAHSHPNQHHYSLNSPNAAGHYINQNLGQIPASNHPVANSTTTGSAQSFTPQKNVSNFISNHEDGLSHQQNQTAYPPVSQSLPPSVSSQPKTTSENLDQQQSDKPQSNGTSEVKSLQKNDNTPDHSLIAKEKSVQPAPVPQLSEVQEKAEEKPTSVPATIPTPLPQLKPSEATNAKAQLLPPPPPPPPVATSKPVPPIIPDTQNSETSPAATTTANSASSAHVRNNNKSASSAITTTTVDTSEKEQPGTKKAKADENPTPPEKVESLKKAKPSESDKEINEERTGSSEKIPLKEDPLPKPTIPATTASPTETAAKSPTRKVKHPPSKSDDPSKLIKDQKVSVQKSPSISKAKRQRVRTQPYQSPLPEVELISKITSLPQRTPRSNDEKLIVFYKKEFLAVRNAEGSFYLCQTMQNIYKSSSKIKIRWLSQDNNDKSGEIYTPDFYDLTDFDCILTNLSLDRIDKGKFRLPPSEKDRTQSILNRSLAVEKGEVTSPSLTEEHPDGLDLSLYRDEDQLKKRATRKRKAGRKPSSLSIAKKQDSLGKSPEAPKVRKIAPPTKIPERNATARKPQQSLKKTTAQPEIKKSTSTKRAPVRGRRKTDDKSPVIDHKKAKVLARIGIKTSIPAARSTPSNVKSAKSRPKVAASSKILTQVKTNAAAKPPPRNARRSARK